jgi:molybdenum cofactor biosynthesis protein B
MAYQEHQSQAGHRPVACAVITCSDSRIPDTDTSGNLIRALLTAAGHTVPFHTITADDPEAIRTLLQQLTVRGDVHAIILNGGTGVSRRDNTFDAVATALTKTLPGFGELFRMLSYEAIGSGALLSRATAGIILTPAPAGRPTLVFSIPGSPNAVELAMHKLILPELSHLVWETLR